MPKISPLQYTLSETLGNILIRGGFKEVRKFLNNKDSIEQLKLFSGQIELSDEVLKTLLLDPLTDEETQGEISTILLDPINFSALKQLITTHQEDIEHLIHGYRKLGKVLVKEKQINQCYTQLEALSMKRYLDGSSMERANFRDIYKSHALKHKIDTLENEKRALLNTREVVAAYELHKLALYAQQLQEGKLVQTPSVQAMKRHLRTEIFSGKTLLLSGPVGTGKTKIAIEIYQEILEAKMQSGKILKGDYDKLVAIPIVNGNEESSPRDLQTKPTQMSNRVDSDKAFVYEEGHLVLCLKYGLPLIIDEANRTPPNFLSSLKKYWAMKAGDRYRDPVTGEIIEVQCPLQVIMTANEGSKYTIHTNVLQDQIEREIQREYIGYLPSHEIYDIFKSKLYLQPGIAYVAPEDLEKTLHNLVNAAVEINELYLGGKEYKLHDGTFSFKMKTTVLDTKRLLALVNRAKIGSKDTFWQEVNENIVDFISRVNNDNDRKILCGIFYAKDLLCSENIPDLINGSGLTSETLTFITNTREQQDTIGTERIISPWTLATTLFDGELVYGQKNKLTFEKLGWNNEETILKGIVTDIRKLNIFNPRNDGEIIEVLHSLEKKDLEEIFLAILKKLDTQKTSKIFVDNINQIVEKMETLNPTISPQWNTRLEGNKTYKEPLRQKRQQSIPSIVTGLSNTPSSVNDYRAGRENGIRDIDTNKKNNIKEIGDKMINEQKFVFEKRGLGDFATFQNIPGLPEGKNGKKFGLLDASALVQKEKDVTVERDYTEYGSWTSIKRNDVYLSAMRGEKTKDWKKSNFKETVVNAETQHNVSIPSENKMETLFTALGDYYQREKKETLNEQEQIALFMYLTGYYGVYWLGDYGKQTSASRSYVRCRNDYRGFGRCGIDNSGCGFLLSD